MCRILDGKPFDLAATTHCEDQNDLQAEYREQRKKPSYFGVDTPVKHVDVTWLYSHTTHDAQQSLITDKIRAC